MTDIEDEFPTQIKIAEEIEEIIWREDCTYLEAIQIYSEQIGYDAVELVPHLHKNIVDKLRVECECSGAIKATNTDNLNGFF